MTLQKPFRFILKTLTALCMSKSTQWWIKSQNRITVCSTATTTLPCAGRVILLLYYGYVRGIMTVYYFSTVIREVPRRLLMWTLLKAESYRSTAILGSCSTAFIGDTLSKCDDTRLAWNGLPNHFPCTTLFELTGRLFACSEYRAEHNCYLVYYDFATRSDLYRHDPEPAEVHATAWRRLWRTVYESAHNGYRRRLEVLKVLGHQL